MEYIGKGKICLFGLPASCGLRHYEPDYPYGTERNIPYISETAINLGYVYRFVVDINLIGQIYDWGCNKKPKNVPFDMYFPNFFTNGNRREMAFYFKHSDLAVEFKLKFV